MGGLIHERASYDAAKATIRPLIRIYLYNKLL